MKSYEEIKVKTPVRGLNFTQAETSVTKEFYHPSNYQQTKRVFQNTAGRYIRKNPNLTTGLVFFSGGALFVAAAASTITTGLDPLLIAGLSLSLAGGTCLTGIGINRLVKHVLK